MIITQEIALCMARGYGDGLGGTFSEPSVFVIDGVAKLTVLLFVQAVS
jgi:hypothetical protein